MNEIGFWDYTCPGHGSLENYSKEDWDRLLDDMAEGGFNSLVLGIKWLTTGYRSRYDWLDQDPDNAAIASDNAVIHYALEGARKRGIRPWLLVVATLYQQRAFGLTPFYAFAPPTAEGWNQAVAYDLDCPGLGERIEMLFAEVVDLFGKQAEGIVVELEYSDGEAPHRVPIYNQWASANGRPDFAQIKAIRLEPRSYPYQHWRDFTTSRRIEMLQRIQRVVRTRGFAGKLASLVEMDNSPMAVLGNTNMAMLQAALPEWPVVTYDSIYDRRSNRLATMDLCIEQPRQLGLDVCYLTRGVMTFPLQPWMGPTTLPVQWQMSLEDAARHRPQVLWFMGTDARSDGLVCNKTSLPQWGFHDGRTARKHLMQLAGEMGLGLGQAKA